MALQTKTFPWGSYAYKSESNAYVLALTLTENSVDANNNRSNISYKLVLKSGDNNRFDGQIDSVIKLNGVQAASGSRKIEAAYNSSWILLEGSTNVSHNQDGSLNMPIEVSINTYNSYAPPVKTLSWSWALTTIPRESTIGTVTGAKLGGTMRVNINRNSTNFTHELLISTGSNTWTEPVECGAYADVTLGLNLASMSPDSASFDLPVRLRTYNGDAQVGVDVNQSIRVTIPETDETRPTATMTLTTLGTFGGRALEGMSKVRAAFTNGKGKYGASISRYNLKVQGVSYGDPYESGFLTKSGDVSVIGEVIDSRGFTGTIQKTVNVLSYHKPQFTGCDVFRCTSDGTAAEDGEYLKVVATVNVAQIQGNSCRLLLRYKVSDGEYGEAFHLCDGQEYSGVVMDVMVDKSKSYSVQLIANDAVGQEVITEWRIPSEKVFRHRPSGGNGVGYGGYCEKEGLMDIHWDTRIRKGLVLGYGIGSVYLSVTEENPAGMLGGKWEKLARIAGYINAWRKIE